MHQRDIKVFIFIKCEDFLVNEIPELGNIAEDFDILSYQINYAARQQYKYQKIIIILLRVFISSYHVRDH